MIRGRKGEYRMADINWNEIGSPAQAEELIAQKKAQIREKYTELGERYYALHSTDAEGELGEIVRQIAEAEGEIAACGELILKLKGLVTCPNCGAQIKEKNIFCTSCGYRLKEQPAPAPEPVPAPIAEAMPEPAAKETAEPVTEPIPAPVQEPPVCPSCGVIIKAGMRFCTKCGTALNAAPAAAPAAPDYGFAPALPKKPFVSEYDFTPENPEPKKPFVSEYNFTPENPEPKKPFVSEYDFTPENPEPKQPFVSEYAFAPAPAPAEKKPFVSDYADAPEESKPFAPAPAPAVPEPIAPAPARKADECPNCGSAVKPGSKFCVRCGTRLDAAPAPAPAPAKPAAPRRCPNCGKELLNDQMRFCTGCGTKLV